MLVPDTGALPFRRTPVHLQARSGGRIAEGTPETQNELSSVLAEDRGRLHAEIGLAVMVVIWGVNFAVVKWALLAFDPLGFNGLRHLLASLFMVGVLFARGAMMMPRTADIPRIIVLGVVGNVVYQMLFIIGLDRTRAGNASLMLALVPLFLLILSGRSGERTAAAWVGAVLSVAGVALVSGSSLRLEGTDTLVGDLLLIGAAGVWAIYTLGARPLIESYGPIRTTAWTLWVGSLGLMLAGIPSMMHQDWGAIGGAEWGGVVFSSVFSIGVAYLLWYVGVQQLGGARTAVFSNLTPVVALAAGAVWLDERLTPAAILGAGLVIGGVVIIRMGTRH